MANLRISALGRNAMWDALRALLDAGAAGATLKVYTGSQPATPETAIGAQVLLATLTMTDPAAPAAAAGVLTFSAITEDASADDTGTAAWARIADSNGLAVFDCDVGTAATTIVLNTVSVVIGGPVRITSGTLTLPA